MSDNSRKQDLREISHLFLSSVRQKQTGNAPLPRRVPPSQRTDSAVELTPEELAQVAQGPASPSEIEPGAGTHLSVLLGSHLESRQSEVAQAYAGHLAGAGRRIGLVEVDAASLRVWICEANPACDSVENASPAPIDGRMISECLEELACDVDRWLISIGCPRVPEARDLLRQVGHFVLLSTCDSDGIVSSYRTLKGTADTLRRDPSSRLPHLALVVAGATDDVQAMAVADKISGVALQFLSWPARIEPPVLQSSGVTAHLVLNCRASQDRASTSSQWQALGDFVSKITTVAQEIRADETDCDQPGRDVRPAAAAPAVAGTPVLPTAGEDSDEVIDLPAGSNDPAAVLSAVLKGGAERWIECPVLPPMCEDARLAVSRDRVLTLLAVPGRGLSELRRIGEAYQWMQQNRVLISMAVPQLAIDAHQLPKLRLLVDHADLSADALQPLMHTGHVSVVAYRKLRWSGRTGLLLEAA